MFFDAGQTGGAIGAVAPAEVRIIRGVAAESALITEAVR